MLRRIAQHACRGEVLGELGRNVGGFHQLVVVVGGAFGARKQPFEGAGNLAVEEGTDRCEGEPARLECSDALETLEMLRPVAAGAPGALGRGEQSLALVVPDRVDGDAGPLGQFVDSPVRHDRASMPSSRCGQHLA